MFDDLHIAAGLLRRICRRLDRLSDTEAAVAIARLTAIERLAADAQRGFRARLEQLADEEPGR